ncbi:MAG TPA: XdhC family protein [Thermoanaerobaculia bacterium]|jgi:xanthine dehydrogenase accessory factor|nr:XdhC family protein [Thermoanaerobaculia bacterium]
MRSDLLNKAADLARRGVPYALAVVVRRLPSSSSREGDMALIRADGGFEGWLGGSCTKPVVVREAQAALADGKPRLLTLTPDPEEERRSGVVVALMTCHSGGTVDVYIDPILPAPRLALFGDSPVAHALSRLGQAMGWSVEADPAAESTANGGAAGGFAVVCSMGENDEEGIVRALALAPEYLGVVASAKRFGEMRETLLGQGVSAASLDSIHSPAGLKIGAKTPEEIALSVVAEIVERRQAAVTSASSKPVEPATTAIDPVCGMTVTLATAKHVAEYDGRTYYFCCGGCRTKFLADPARFLVAGGAP